MLNDLISFKKHFYLEEKTFNLKKDADWIYNKYMKGFKKEIDDGIFPQKEIIDAAFQGKGATRWEFSSGELKTKSAKLAHKINPVKIQIGVFPTPAYSPEGTVINLSFNPYVLRILAQHGEMGLPDDQKKRFKAEMQKPKLIATISHELSHWVSDTLHNSHIARILDVAKELGSAEIVKLGKQNVNMTYFEIDAQVHGIKSLKQGMPKKQWDTKTMDDVFELYPSLYSIGESLKMHGKDVLNIWLKLLMKRLAREKLLGKNMKRFPKI